MDGGTQFEQRRALAAGQLASGVKAGGAASFERGAVETSGATPTRMRYIVRSNPRLCTNRSRGCLAGASSGLPAIAI